MQNERNEQPNKLENIFKHNDQDYKTVNYFILMIFIIP